MNTKLLKQKILDLAIRGKLTQQLKSDGNTADLLKEISSACHPERCAKSAKSKDLKQIIPLDKSEAPFEIPANWEWVRLGDVVLNRDAERKPVSKKDRNLHAQKIYDYYGAAGAIDKVEEYLFDEKLLLIGEDGANLLSRSKPNAFLANGKYWVNNHAHVIDAIDKSMLDYLAFYINAISLDDFVTGTAQPKLNQENLNKIPIPLPPLAEQQRIVAKIEEAFAEIDAIEKNKELLKTHIKQTRQKILDLAIHGKLVPQNKSDEPASVLLERITRDSPHYEKIGLDDVPFDIPKSWCWCRLGDVLNIARGGSPRPIQDYLTNEKDGLNWIKIGDTEKGGKYIETVKEKIKPSGLSHTRAVKAGDFLLTNSMSFGRPYILKVDGCIHDGWLVLGNVEKSMIPDFLYFMLSSDFIYQSFAFAAAGSTVKNLKSETVQGTLFPLPPLAEQSRIVTKIEELFSALDQMERNLV